MLVAPELSDHLPVLHLGRGGPRSPSAPRLDRVRAGGDDPRRLARGRLRGAAAAARRADRRRAVAARRRPRPAPASQPTARRRRGRAHYVRPGRPRRARPRPALGPAVLATWDPARDRFEHFGWGITPELARRVGRRAGDFELEVDRRRDVLDGLVAADVTDPDRSTPSALPPIDV